MVLIFIPTANLYDMLETTFTEEDIRILKEFGHYMADYKTLRRRRMDCFDEHGRVTVTNSDGVDELRNGRYFILFMIDFFESEDKAFCYNICADIKEVLDEYDKKFIN